MLLAHQPVVIDDAVRYGVDLQLSGHTHGGQLWPGKYLAELANPTVAGLERYGDTQLYVSRGTGAGALSLVASQVASSSRPSPEGVPGTAL
ncbi:metallophosphoesterase family protein [Actinoplanes awajinensis]|uniref:Calcineurin-like phosphoesterase domain-containing protein n=1 Tax=Actinoplanes awajinensis subsp. mycoplanecinus TaxID=135947 RepID=A0A101JFG8_9ACTN|nr:hypothetical protein ADL15_39850 [Actinoplanes awajinensis subsp. mycoplanecinus]